MDDSRSLQTAEPLNSEPISSESVTFTEKRCSLCGARRLSSGVCSLVSGRDGSGGCPDPTHDYRVERGELSHVSPPWMLSTPTAEPVGRRALSDLLLAVHILAMRGFSLGRDEHRPVRVCNECGYWQRSADAVRHHAAICRTGQVLNLLAEISESLKNQVPSPGKTGVDAAAGGVDTGLHAAVKCPTFCSCGAHSAVERSFLEPWTHHAGGLLKDGADREIFHAEFGDLPAEDSQRFVRRIAACVNLCQGLPTEAIEQARAAMVENGRPTWTLQATPIVDGYLRRSDSISIAPVGVRN